MQRTRAWATRHPRVMDACVAVAAAALALPQTIERTEITGIGWLWFVAIHTPLVWRRRAPVLVFWIAFAAVGLSDLAGIDEGVFQFFVPLFAVYAVARHRPQRYLWPAVAVIEATAVLAWLQDSGTWGRELVAVTAVLVATALLGLTIRIRRAYLDQLEERTRRLERERDQQAQLAVAAERARIAREMHDIVAHNLTVMVALAYGATMTATARPERAAEVMAKVSTTGREALAALHRRRGGAIGHRRRRRPAAAPAAGGHGLAGMAERAASYGGRVDAGPAPGTGWRVRARLLLGEQAIV